jgi:predicted RNA-binding Zn-ribbon protein involved in translation (DUF1610 family)
MSGKNNMKPIYADQNHAAKICSICQTAVVTGELILVCPSCDLPFHQECWNENGGCSQYGCAHAPATVKTASDTELVSHAWGNEKACPNCGKTIKARAILCRFCGASFGTREELSQQEYQAKQFESDQYSSARIRLILLFFVGATGFLAPLAIILLGIVIFSNDFMGIKYRFLPPALRALTVCSFVMSIFLFVMMILFCIFD